MVMKNLVSIVKIAWNYLCIIVFVVLILVFWLVVPSIGVLVYLIWLAPAAGEENFDAIKLVVIFWCIQYRWKLIRWWFSISIADANDIELKHVARASVTSETVETINKNTLNFILKNWIEINEITINCSSQHTFSNQVKYAEWPGVICFTWMSLFTIDLPGLHIHKFIFFFWECCWAGMIVNNHFQCFKLHTVCRVTSGMRMGWKNLVDER